MPLRTPSTLLAAALITLAALHAGRADADMITYVGSDLTTQAHWRTTSVVKPLDGDGDNIYGTDGYVTFGGGPGGYTVNPSYATVAALPPNQFPGYTGGYFDFDSPSDPATQIYSGLLYGNPVPSNTSVDLVSITLSAAASFEFGIIMDNADDARYSPDHLEIRQTIGGSADSGLVSTPNRLLPQPEGNYFFFNISGEAGDSFILSGTNSTSSSGYPFGIYGVTFDGGAVAVPEPSSLALIAIGGAAGLGYAARRRLARA